VTAETAHDRGAELPRLRRQLTGDLEMIVTQALQADPSRRYPSAEALAEDVRRHLVGLPLLARPDTVLYRATKFVTRHRTASAAAALTILAILAGAGATAWQARVAAGERDRARAEAAKVEQVNHFLQTMLGAPSPTRSGRDVRVVEVLDAAATRVGDELADQPDLEATVRRTLGITYEDLGLYDEAEIQLRRALDLRTRVLGPDHLETAQSLKDVALVTHWKGELDTAAVYYRESIARFRAGGEPTRGLAEALNDYGTLLLDLRRFDEAESFFREAQGMMRGILGDSHPDVASNLNNIAFVLHERKDAAGAGVLYREALEIQRRAAGRDNVDVAYTLNNLAWVHRDLGDMAAADSLFRLSLDIRRRELGDAHPSVAVGLNNLAMLVLLPSGRVEAADSALADAAAVLSRTTTGDHPYVANLLNARGRVRLAQNRFAEAESFLRDAFAMRQRLLGERSVGALQTAADLGAALMAQGKRNEARRILADALPTLESAQHESAVRVMTLLASAER
jgi:tetratricopeptide (TPR) repeat protein